MLIIITCPSCARVYLFSEHLYKYNDIVIVIIVWNQ